MSSKSINGASHQKNTIPPQVSHAELIERAIGRTYEAWNGKLPDDYLSKLKSLYDKSIPKG